MTRERERISEALRDTGSVPFSLVPPRGFEPLNGSGENEARPQTSLPLEDKGREPQFDASGFPARDANPVRECDCSQEWPWVIGCVHFGEAGLTLRDYWHPTYRLRYERRTRRRYEVFGHLAQYGPYIQGYQGNDLDGAIASLHEEGARLPRGEP